MAVEVALGESRPSASDDVIRTVGLTKVFGAAARTVRAVDGLDLTVRAGEIFGLLGPNGAGKTTTVGMLTTRVVPTGGTASVGGIDVVAHPALAKQVIGVVPQTNTLDRSLDVYENLYFHGRYFGMNHRRARAVATRFLGPVPARRPGPGRSRPPLGRDGPAAHGGAGDHARAAHPVSRRTDGRT